MSSKEDTEKPKPKHHVIVTAYKNKKGKEPLENWLESLKDHQTIFRIRDRVDRIAEFNFFGDYKQINQKIYELRFHFGPGYRIYFTYQSEEVIVILCGGDKSSQSVDITKAKQLLEESEND